MPNLNPELHIPLHGQLKQVLLEQIEDGVYRPGEILPPELNLARDYCISRATVRRAMQEMEHEGYIHRVAGKGTFVLRARIDRGLSRMTSFSENMRERGQVVTSRYLEVTRKAPPEHIAKLLHVEPGTQMTYIYRLRLADDLPIALTISYVKLPEDVALSESELGPDVSLWSLLERKGVRLVDSDKTLEAILASEEFAHLLEVAVGAPLLMVEGVAYTLGHVPVEFSQVISSGDRYKYTIHVDR
jgi:GntR family transcriptional regulator